MFLSLLDKILPFVFAVFFDQIRFGSLGGISFHLKSYMNTSDQDGMDKTISYGSRVIPKSSSPNNILHFNFVNYTDSLNWPMYKVLKQTSWYNNLMTLAGGTSVPRHSIGGVFAI